MLRSLRSQTIAVVISGLVLSNATGIALYLRDRHDSLLLTEALDIAERAAGVSRLLRDLPGDWRAEVVQASDSRAFRVWTSNQPLLDDRPMSEEEQRIAGYLRSFVPRIAHNEIRVRFADTEPRNVPPPQSPPEETALTPAPPPGWNLAISIDHGGGEWLGFLGHVNTPKSYLSSLLAPGLVLAAIVVGALAYLLLSRVTAPLYRLATAAEKFGHNIYEAPMDESGSHEVQVAARAFNTMRLRLIRMIEARTEMLIAISHDLRTPITQVRLRVETMLPKGERLRALKSLHDMNAIITTFLDFARATNDTEEHSTIDLSSLVESICNDFEDAGAAISCDAPGRIVLNCKRVAMKRALSNLIKNAVTYGGTVHVSVTPGQGEAVVLIDDEGPGIPESELEAVFAPFNRLEASRSAAVEGTGLGLSIARAIAEDHGGSIRLSNRATGGLRAELRLPVT